MCVWLSLEYVNTSFSALADYILLTLYFACLINSADGYLVCFSFFFFCLVMMNKATMNCFHKSFSGYVFSFIKDKYLGVEFLSHMRYILPIDSPKC